MKNILVRTGTATLVALTLTAGAITPSSASAAAAPMHAQNLTHYVGGKHHQHRAHHRHQRLDPRLIVHLLTLHGYRDVRRLHYSKGKYYARAKGRRGPVKLVVSARTGHILSRQRIYRPHRYRWDRRHYHGRPSNGFSWSFSLGR